MGDSPWKQFAASTALRKQNRSRSGHSLLWQVAGSLKAREPWRYRLANSYGLVTAIIQKGALFLKRLFDRVQPRGSTEVTESQRS